MVVSSAARAPCTRNVFALDTICSTHTSPHFGREAAGELSVCNQMVHGSTASFVGVGGCGDDTPPMSGSFPISVSFRIVCVCVVCVCVVCATTVMGISAGERMHNL